MKKLLVTFTGIALLAACATQQSAKIQQSAQARTEVQGRRPEILFLGDNGHHQPIKMAPYAMAALGNRGINFTYTDRLEDVNPQNLARFDGVLLYANWDSIPKPQEQSLLDYVAGGKGLIAVHCASYCFRNSAPLVEMMGGQFWRHTWDTIRPVWTKPGHAALAGTKPVSTLDETYLHQKLQPDNLVLTERLIQPDQTKDKPGQATEPYTWVRTHGKGRVFYTAYGHDQNTWANADFENLLESGIKWAVGEEPVARLAALKPEPFRYAEAALPNYERRPGPQLKPEPLSPEESMKYLQLHPDFSLSLVAHEPNIQHPIAMAWDEGGRAFVIVTLDYPNERKPEGQGRDYILRLDDTNGDGKADTFTQFADNLSVPTSLLAYGGGFIVSQAPDMLFLKDTDGDGKADVRKVLFTGLGTSDTHAGPSNLHYGFDNWIYASIGYAGFNGTVGGKKQQFGQGFFRFKPDGSELEYLTSTSNNTWGLAFDETGNLFGSTANNDHGWYMAIPNRYLVGVDKLRQRGGRGIDTHKDMKSLTRIRQVDVFGGYTAAAGHNFYTARAFPKNYWNRIAFVAEPTGHLVHLNPVEKMGTDFSDKNDFNLIAGADEWFSPVFAEVGPDGAVYVLDWYSFIIQHNPTPKGFENGTGNAYQTDLRDNSHGRLYRIAYKNAP
ncbi:MAG: ThuA domain-containing protein, partial [Sphingobacteriaceae bacterium]|nr:ThuA domain-containing protein [Cytophagaceae bacterium]